MYFYAIKYKQVLFKAVLIEFGITTFDWILRGHLPKGKDFNQIDEKLLLTIQDKLNSRPRKIIGYKTPQELWILN